MAVFPQTSQLGQRSASRYLSGKIGQSAAEAGMARENLSQTSTARRGAP